MLKGFWKSNHLKTLNGPVILFVWDWTSSLDVAKFKLSYKGHSAVEPLQTGPIRKGVPSSCIAGKGSEDSGYPVNLAIWLPPYPVPIDLASHYRVFALHLSTLLLLALAS